jgi:hypothetical protein
VLTYPKVRSAPVLENGTTRLSLTNFLTGFCPGFQAGKGLTSEAL